MCYISTGKQSSVRGTQSSVRETQSSVRGTQSSVRGTQSSVRGTQPSVRGTQPSVRGTQSSARGTQSSVRGTQSGVRGTQSSVREGSYLHNPSAKLFPQAIIFCWASLCVIVPARTPLMDMIWSPGITPQLADIVPGVTCSCYTYTQYAV